MRPFLCALLLRLALAAIVAAPAQEPMPRPFLPRTIVILHDTKTGEVSDGALEQLKRWGRFTIVDDADSADIVLRFDKKTDREAKQPVDRQKGTTTWSGTMTFSSQVHMRAYLKGSGSPPFFATEDPTIQRRRPV